MDLVPMVMDRDALRNKTIINVSTIFSLVGEELTWI